MSAFVALSVVLVFSLLLLYFGQVMLFNQQQSAHFEYFLSTFKKVVVVLGCTYYKRGGEERAGA